MLILIGIWVLQEDNEMEDSDKAYEELRQSEKDFYAMQGFSVDIKAHFYYDESNNCRKFSLKQKNGKGKFNVDPFEDFILAGVVDLNDMQISFEELLQILELQNNVIEIKFKNHFSYGTFLKCMNRRRVRSLLKWIDKNNLLLHYTHVNNFYYAIVEIIDSTMSITDIDTMGFDYFSVKSTFYEMLLEKKESVQELMYKYEFPNVKKEKNAEFLTDILRLFPRRYELTLEQKFITGMLDKAKQNEKLVFINDNIDHVMQENYQEFYFDHPRKYLNSMHTFDEETQIVSNPDDKDFSFLGIKLENVEYVNSKSSILVQVSDVIAGLLGKLMVYINGCDSNTIRNDVDNLTDLQLENISLLGRLRIKSCLYNKGFLMSVTAISVIKKMDFLFELCEAKYLKSIS